jgi:predicted AAA+ superfamily ATPase
MDFEEFLWAMGKDIWADEIRRCADTMDPNIVHEQVLMLYKHYLCVGGLPACVRDFVETGAELVAYIDTNIKSIITAYIADMGKYTTGNAERVKIESVFGSIPRQLGREDRKFRYSLVETGGNKAKYETAIEWLISAGMILRSNLLDKIEIPLKPFESTSAFKLYCSDTGILTALSEMPYRDILLETNTMYRGILAENYVAVQLHANGFPLRYWSSGNTAEVDFIINNADGIIPIEVKSGTSTQSKSLKVYMEKYRPPYAMRLSAKNFGYENGIKSLPLYAAFCVK